MKCGFCNLFTTTQTTSEALDRYTDSLLAEAEILARQVDWRCFEVDSLYIGGGTPTLLSLSNLESLIRGLRDLFTFRPSAELAIESAPNSIDEAKLHDLRGLGFLRLSVGIQSFNDRELQMMGRHYDPKLGRTMAAAAMSAGFDNVNIDLIFGLPGQTQQTWLTSLAAAVELGVKTITVYPLALRSRTQFGKTFVQSPSTYPRGADRYAYYDIAVDYLTSHGYEQRTSVAFVLDGGGCRHESNEFAGIPTLGLGVAALSYAPGAHYTSGHYFGAEATSRTIADYLAAVDQNRLPIRSAFLLDTEERQRRSLILGLLSTGLNPYEYERTFHEPPEASFALELTVLEEEGCLDRTRSKFALTPRGRRFSSLVADLLSSSQVKALAASYR
jgi:oxygen-independent coproporphyrinogen-3 oxidase